MKIEHIKEQFPDEWILIEVLKVDKFGKVLEGKLIAHSKKRNDTYKAMETIRVSHVAHFWNGKISDDYCAAFPQIS